jgi:hypothetical protein
LPLPSYGCPEPKPAVCADCLRSSTGLKCFDCAVDGSESGALSGLPPTKAAARAINGMDSILHRTRKLVVEFPVKVYRTGWHGPRHPYKVAFVGRSIRVAPSTGTWRLRTSSHRLAFGRPASLGLGCGRSDRGEDVLFMSWPTQQEYTGAGVRKFHKISFVLVATRACLCASR